MKNALLLLFMTLSIACNPTYSHSASPPSSYGNEAGYNSGLSETLEDAPTQYASEVMTKFYNLGYSIGRVEGSETRFHSEDGFKEMGCVAILPALLEAGIEIRGLGTCKGLIRAEFSEAKIAGPRFAKGRLLTSRKGAETDDPRITAMLLRSYENGYAMGFKQSQEEGDPLGDLRNAATHGCQTHIMKHIQHPGVASLLSQCEKIGRDQVTEYLNQLERVQNSR